MSDGRRRLLWHGTLLFLLGLGIGLDTAAMANPRMGLSAHVGTLLNAVFLIALAAAFWLLVASSYGGSLGLVLAAVLGTRLSTPIHGATAAARDALT